MKNIYLAIPVCFIIINVFFINEARSQTYGRLSNPKYVQTKLKEDFSRGSLNRTVWKVISGTKKDNLYIFADTDETVRLRRNTLELSMLKSPGFSAKTWSPRGDTIITADFIAAEVMTIKDYSYGIFECRATFADGRGSFPAFWLYNDTMCFESERPEIDIAELKVEHRRPTLDNHIWYYPFGCFTPTSHEYAEHKFSWGGTHTFKGIWTPEKIEFWVDNTLLKEVFNAGQYWYPVMKQHVILSQQIVRYGRWFPDSLKIVTPQTSRIHWVRVKEFFLAPEIKCPDIISSEAVANLDVDNASSEITWDLTPKLLFSGKTSGRGKRALIKPSANHNGKGKLIYSFKMPSGETFTAEKELEINSPGTKTK